jgi:hypothetical protein
MQEFKYVFINKQFYSNTILYQKKQLGDFPRFTKKGTHCFEKCTQVVSRMLSNSVCFAKTSLSSEASTALPRNRFRTPLLDPLHPHKLHPDHQFQRQSI